MPRKKRASDVLRLMDRVMRDASGRTARAAIVRRVRQAQAFHDFMGGWSMDAITVYMNEPFPAETNIREHGNRLMRRRRTS